MCAELYHIDDRENRRVKRIHRHCINQYSRIDVPMILAYHENHHSGQCRVHNQQDGPAQAVTAQLQRWPDAAPAPEQKKPHDSQQRVINRQRDKPPGAVIDSRCEFQGNIKQVDQKSLIQGNAGAKANILRKPFYQGNPQHFSGQWMSFDPLCESCYDAGTTCYGNDQRIGGEDIYRIRQRPVRSLIQYIDYQCKGRERDAKGWQRQQEKYPFQNGFNLFHGPSS